MEEYSRSLLRSSVAQICKELGHLEVEESAFSSLTEILQKYIEEVGYRSQRLAEESHRTDCSFYDVEFSLDEMGTKRAEIEEYVTRTEEIPFTKQYAPYPIKKKKKNINENNKRLLERPSYVPDFLPQFPDERTYHTTANVDDNDFNLSRSKKSKSENKQMIENYLSKLETHEGSNGNNTNAEQMPINFETKRISLNTQDDENDELPPKSLYNPYLQSSFKKIDLNRGNPVFTSVVIKQVQADRNVQNVSTPDYNIFSDFDDKNSKKSRAMKILELKHKTGLEDTK
eukprot:TRINITY_DN8469_c0_g1_i1.p1 TRINITY_DN8469_c0_g1~~TRINITY_DN8469_c0_g1_i1.p1  ORF type:complete len:300 (+),score=100.84 TRINITY_DN8469_c0_g1_i1:44-901(+)